MGRQYNTGHPPIEYKIWTACVQDRAKWKNVVEKAKTSNKGS
jgi:hypothetical protein